MVSEKDREAYEKGKKDAEHPIMSSFDVARAWRYSSSEEEAYSKGLRGEQLDGDKSGLEKKT